MAYESSWLCFCGMGSPYAPLFFDILASTGRIHPLERFARLSAFFVERVRETLQSTFRGSRNNSVLCDRCIHLAQGRPQAGLRSAILVHFHWIINTIHLYA